MIAIVFVHSPHGYDVDASEWETQAMSFNGAPLDYLDHSTFLAKKKTTPPIPRPNASRMFSFSLSIKIYSA
jgi:hypothetical protein